MVLCSPFVVRLAAMMVVSLGGLIGYACAQDHSYPVKPVRMVVPYPPGGTTDLVGRVMAQQFTKRLGQTFIIENRAGAAGQIGTDAVAKALADGYTLLVGASGPVTMLPALSPDLPYNILGDFETIGNMVTVPNLMVVNPSSGINSLNDLIDFAKKNPGQVRYASGGPGSSGHVAAALLSSLAGIDMQHIPYRGGGPALAALMSNETHVIFENLPSALAQTRGGKLKGIAVLSAKRTAAAPEFPSTAELGMPRFTIASSTGLLAPRGAPRSVVERLAHAMKSIAEDPASAKQFANYGADVDYMDPSAYRAYIQDEIKRFAELGKRANITLK